LLLEFCFDVLMKARPVIDHLFQCNPVRCDLRLHGANCAPHSFLLGPELCQLHGCSLFNHLDHSIAYFSFHLLRNLCHVFVNCRGHPCLQLALYVLFHNFDNIGLQLVHALATCRGPLLRCRQFAFQLIDFVMVLLQYRRRLLPRGHQDLNALPVPVHCRHGVLDEVVVSLRDRFCVVHEDLHLGFQLRHFVDKRLLIPSFMDNIRCRHRSHLRSLHRRR